MNSSHGNVYFDKRTELGVPDRLGRVERVDARRGIFKRLRPVAC